MGNNGKANGKEIIDSLESLTPEEARAMADLILLGDLEPLRLALEASGKNIQSIILGGTVVREALEAARAEYLTVLNARVMLMSTQALATLERAMAGQIPEKKATAAVRAAAEVLDRGVLPKQTRADFSTNKAGKSMGLPSLQEALEGATTQEAVKITREYEALITQVENMRARVGRVIDGSTVEGKNK